MDGPLLQEIVDRPGLTAGTGIVVSDSDGVCCLPSRGAPCYDLSVN